MLRLPIENTSDKKGEIMAEWKNYTLEEVCERIYSGGTPSTKHEEYWNGDIKWLSSGETSQRFVYDTERKITQEGVENSSTKLATKGCTVVATAGQGYTRGQASFLMTDTYMNQSVIACKANENVILPLYLYYNLDSRYEEFRLLSDGTSTRGGLSGWILKRMEIKLPPKSSQKKIIDILYSIDKKIEKNKAINNNLEQQYISIVDNLLSKLTQYKIYSLLEVADCQNGRAFYKEGYDPNGAFVIDLGNVNTSGNFVRTAADKYISLDRYKEPKLEKYRVYKNDIVMVMTDRKSTMELLGKVGKIYKDGYYLLNQRMYRIRAKKGINTNYLYACLNSTETSNFLKRKALGSVQKYVNTGEINSIEIKVPSSEKMDEIASILDPIFSQMESNILENESLNELRDILLPKLMSGEIDVSNINL